MALRDLVDGECGGTNSLVRLTSHIVQDRGLKEEGFRTPFPHGESFTSSNADQLVQQFFEERLAQTTPTFRMDSLLVEMRDLEREVGTVPPVQSAPIAQLAAEQDVSCWAEQYLEAGKHFQESNQYSIWSEHQNEPKPSSSDTFELGFGPNWAKEYLQSTSGNIDLDEPVVNLNELGASEEYSAEPTAESSDLKDTATEILNTSAEDPRFNYSKFMKFMSQISDGSVTIEEGVVKDAKADDEFTTSFLQGLKEYSHEVLNDTWKEANEEVSKDVSGLQENKLLNVPFSAQEAESNVVHQHPWTDDYLDYLELTSHVTKYKFVDDNSMADLPNSMEEGIKYKEAGNIPSAVLCFESAVKADPENSAAWFLLANTQAENEQDTQAIAAFRKCLTLEPNNLAALMGLAVSYTNENYDHHACCTLKDWLKANPKYSDLVQKNSSWSTMDLHKDVCEKFIIAARRNPQDMDPDVQCGLGVLFNLTNEQNKAVDCFKSALQVRPNDFALWNRLGATLANGGRPEEAVDAYHNALQLYPGFIRARYNLGITCTHLGAHREAVEHFLSALTIQAASERVEKESSTRMSETIWSTLRLVISFLDRPELIQAVIDRNLDKLNTEFNITGNKKS